MKIKRHFNYFSNNTYLQLYYCTRKTSKSFSDFNNAIELAKKENKNIFILFHASWCGWCKKMDASMNEPSVKDFFTNNFVIEHLVVLKQKTERILKTQVQRTC